MAVSIHFEHFDLTLISVYRHPHESQSPSEYDSLFAFCNSFSHVILLGDFNAHHQEWGSGQTNKEGSNLLASALNSSFTCINGSSSTFLTRPHHSKSVIDLAFVSPSVIDFCEWFALDNTYFSDHFPIMIRFNFLLKRRKLLSHKIKLSKSEKINFFRIYARI